MFSSRSEFQFLGPGYDFFLPCLLIVHGSYIRNISDFPIYICSYMQRCLNVLSSDLVNRQQLLSVISSHMFRSDMAMLTFFVLLDTPYRKNTWILHQNRPRLLHFTFF